MAESGKRTVLVVDDADDIRTIITVLIQGRGHHVVPAENGKQALQALENGGKVDLILLDVMMPEMDGFETLYRMRERGVNIPVVMLTARSADADIIKGYQ